MAQQKIQKHIEIVRSSIPSLSSMGQKSCDALHKLLKQHYATVGVTIANTIQDLDILITKQPDLVFMGMKFVPGILPHSKVWISDYLTQHDIAHTGSPKGAIELEQDKPLAKQRVLDVGLKTSPYVIAEKGKPFNALDVAMRLPLFAKPTSLGAGVGVDDNSVVHTLSELRAKVNSIAVDHGADTLIEEFLSGREFSVAVLKDEHSEDLIVMPLELIAGANIHGDRILSSQLKSAALETPVFPVANGALRTALTELATDVFTALGARDYGRIDIRLDAEGTPHFLEANLIPCLIEDSGNFPKACMMNIGTNYEAMILHIVRLGMARQTTVELEEQAADSVTVYSPAAITA